MLRRNVCLQTNSSPFRVCLVCHSIGVRATPLEAIDLACEHGFDSVGFQASGLLAFRPADRDLARDKLKSCGLIFGAVDLPVEFRGSDEEFGIDLGRLPAIAAAVREMGGDRFWTWLAPCHEKLPFEAHFDLHVRRLGRVAAVLQAEGLRLGLEYLAPQTLRRNWDHPFIHTLSQTRRLIEAIGSPVLGVVLDSFHWHAASESTGDITALPDGSVVAVDLSDAPMGVAVHDLRDDARELPEATGVIDTVGFLQAAASRAADRTPIRAEPFNPPVNPSSNREFIAMVATALNRALAPLVGGI